jgi:glutaredoxin 2
MGRYSQMDPYLCKLDRCPFCSQSCHTIVGINSATASLRVLSIDDDGIRAAILT